MREVLDAIDLLTSLLEADIAGIYGMNFRSMPELEWSFGYPLALGSMVLVMVVLYRVFKHKKWR